jgi:hypothetical protein
MKNKVEEAFTSHKDKTLFLDMYKNNLLCKRRFTFTTTKHLSLGLVSKDNVLFNKNSISKGKNNS